MMLRGISAYRTVSTEAVCIIIRRYTLLQGRWGWSEKIIWRNKEVTFQELIGTTGYEEWKAVYVPHLGKAILQ